jgi:microcystin-dependent protein
MDKQRAVRRSRTETTGATCVDRHLALRGPVRASLAACVAAAALAGGIARPATSLPASPNERVPRQIPYRGYLEQDGVPQTNPSVAMVFELCTFQGAVSGSADCPWTEAQTVSVQDGNFSVALGDSTTIPPSLFAQPMLYLGITVNGQRLVGRQRILAVPYAQHAGDASKAVPPGTVVAYMGGKAPDGWLLCDGQPFDATRYPALLAVLGSAVTPDLRSRFPMGSDPARRGLWSTGGAETKALSTREMPPHNHTGVTSDESARHVHAVPWGANGSGGQNWTGGGGHTGNSAENTTGHTHAIPVEGEGIAFEILPPYFVVNWIIKATY